MFQTQILLLIVALATTTSLGIGYLAKLGFVEVHGSGTFLFSFACFICAAFSKNPSFAR